MNKSNLLTLALPVLLAFATVAQAEVVDIGPLDDTLTHPANPVARNFGVWNGEPNEGGTTLNANLQFRKNGHTGMFYDECVTYAFMHPQHVVRMPNKNGRAYFAVSNSDNDGYSQFKGPAGRLIIYRTDGAPDPVSDRVPPSSRSDGTHGEIIWEHQYDSSSPVGAWNHPCKMEMIGNLLLVSVQQFNSKSDEWYYVVCGDYGEGSTPDAVLFYDVRDPENPKYWGKMTTQELRNPSEISDASLIRAGDRWILNVDGRWWYTDTVSPDINAWTYGGTGIVSSQHGQNFSSYEHYDPPSSAPAGTVSPGMERVMFFDGGDDEEANQVGGDEFIVFYDVVFGPVCGPSPVRGQGPDTGFLKLSPQDLGYTSLYIAVGKSNPRLSSAPNLFPGDKDYDGCSIYVSGGVPIVYAPIINSLTFDYLLDIFDIPQQADTIAQVWNPANVRRTGALLPVLSLEISPGTPLVDGLETIDFAAAARATNAITFTIRNLADTNAFPLEGLKVWVDGLDSGNFSVTQPPAKIGPGSSATFTVVFEPRAAGNYGAALHIATYDTVRTPFDIALTGTATAAEIVIEQPPGGELKSGGGTIEVWGGDSVERGVPAGLGGVRSISAGFGHTLALKDDGTVAAWGYNDSGQTTVPVGLTAVSSIAAGRLHSLAVKNDGTVVAWGNSVYGQTTVPPGLSGVVAIAAGGAYSMALKSDSTVVLWGGGDCSLIPPDGLTNVTAIAAGDLHAVALRNDGTVVAWGYGVYGETDVPPGLSGVIAIAAGSRYTLALKSDGTVVSWGYGLTPAPAGLSDVIEIVGGDRYAVAIKEDGTIVGWGRNFAGQTTIPVGLSGVTAISAGGDHMVAVVQTSSVYLGTANAGTTGVPKTFAIRNTGTAPLGITGVSVVGQNSGEFVVNTTGLSSSVPLGGQTTFTVAFAPAVAGERTATLRVHSISSAGTTDIHLVGTGTTDAPELLVEHVPGTPLSSGSYTLAFGNQSPETISLAQTLTVKNTGVNPLTLDVESEGDFVVNTGEILNSIPGGGQTIISVQFAPRSGLTGLPPGTSPVPRGPRAATLRILSNDGDENPFDIALTGTVVDLPEIEVEQYNGLSLLSGVSGFAFGEQAPGSFGEAKSFTIRNMGITNLHITGVSTATGDSADFSVSTNGMLGTLPTGGQTTFTVTFTPSALGPRSSTLRVFSNDEDEGVFEVSLTGTGIAAPELVVEQPPGTVYGTSFVVAWGESGVGQTMVPPLLSSVRSVAAGYGHTVALGHDGTVAAWGWDFYGQATVPTGLSNVTGIAAGRDYTVALKTDGTVAAWGDDTHDQTAVPPGLSNVTAVSAGSWHTVALQSDGTVAAWGWNPYDQATVPVGLSNVTEIAAGDFHTVALKDDGTVEAWGYDGQGQTTVPAGLSNVTAIAAGYSHTVALKGDGTVVVWGGTSYGQTTVPAGLSNVTAIAAGDNHTVVLKDDGTVVEWGNNLWGQRIVPAGLSGVTAIAAGYNHTVAVVASRLSFGNQAVTTTSAAKTFTLKNTGVAPLNIAGVSVTGGDSGDFNLNVSGMTGSIPAGGQTSFDVSFTPAVLGLRTTTLRVLSDDPDEGAIDITLTGFGIAAPDIVLEHPPGTPLVAGVSTIDFTNQATNTISAAKAVTIRNTGLGPLSINAVSVTGGNSGDFAVNTNGMVGSVPVDGQTTFNVTFNPTALGARTTTLQVLSDDLDEGAIDITLTGTGAGIPEIVLEHPVDTPLVSGVTAIDFAGQVTNTVSTAKTFTIKNEGIAPLTLVGVTVVGGDAGDFAVNTNGMPGSVAEGGETTFSVTFHPTAPGNRTTTLQVVSDDEDEATIAIAFTGTGLAYIPEIVIEHPPGAPLLDSTFVAVWGDNTYGQTLVPAGLGQVAAVAAGSFHTLVLNDDGTVAAWGYDAQGQATVPAGLSNVISIAAGRHESMAVKADGTVVAWGDNGQAQATVPGGLSNVVVLAMGANHTVALKDDGSLVTWGENLLGQTTVPAGLSNVTAIAAGDNHSVALRSDGTLEAWGDNTYGQATVPVGLSNVTAITAGLWHTVALKGDGTVVAWGHNGSTTVPAGLSAVSSIAAGGLHTVALKSDGTVEAWGDNRAGQALVPEGLSGVSVIAAGTYHTVAVVPPALAIFAGQTVGTTSAAKSFTIKNTGVAPLNIAGVIVTGGDSTDFAVNTNGMGGSIPAAGQTSFSVSFSPGTVGSRTTTLRVLSNDPDEGTTDITLTGLGIAAPDIVLESPSGTPLTNGVSTIDFANQATNATSAARTFTVANTGLGLLNITGVSVTGGDSGDFVVNTNALPGSIASGGDTTFSVSFNPTVLGSRTTILRVLSDDPDEGTIDITLIGTGVLPPEIVLEHPVGTPLVSGMATIDYGSQVTNTTGVAKTFGITNTGPGQLNISGVSVIGGDSGDFVVNTNAMPGSIAAGAQTTFSVTFTPAGLGWRTTTLRVLSDDPDEGTTDITLTGTGVAYTPEIVIEHPAGTPLISGNFVVTWGDNSFGQTTVPTGLDEVIAIAGGVHHSVALKTDGTVVAWGRDLEGQTTVPAGLSGVTAIAGGVSHTVAVKDDGTVTAWGQNTFGQATVPVGLSNVTAVAGGERHSVALKTDGTVEAWGDATYDQTTVPVGLSNATAIAAGYRHTVALVDDGTVMVWGHNAQGQTLVPAGLSNVTAVAAGSWHTVVLKNDGTVEAWGFNGSGQTTVPVGLSNVTAIAAGYGHTVVLKNDGTVEAWGYSAQATGSAGLSGVNAIAAGTFHTLALAGAPPLDLGTQSVGIPGAAQTFTIRNTGYAPLSILGVSTTGGDSGDFGVDTNGMLGSVPAGSQTTFTVTYNPTAIGLRTTTLQVLSDDPSEDTTEFTLTGTGRPMPEIALEQPVDAPLFSGVSIVDFGDVATNGTGITKTFTIRNTGPDPLSVFDISVVTGEGGAPSVDFSVDTTGMLTNVPAGALTTFTVTFNPTPLGLRTAVLGVFSNDADENPTTILLTGAGHLPEILVEHPLNTPLVSGTAVVVWGNNASGQAMVPVGLSGIAAIAAGASHTVVLKNEGTVEAWGWNLYGQTNVPAGLSNVMAIAAGDTHTVALKDDGTVEAWGNNGYGQTNVPAGLSNVTAVAAGALHTVVLKNDGTVVAWGYGGYGQTNVPAGLSNVIAVAAGDLHTVAVRSDGTVAAWGSGSLGQTAVPPWLSGVTAIAAGRFHTVALRYDGTVEGWGYNEYGQISPPAGLGSVSAIAAGDNHTVAVVGPPVASFDPRRIGTTSQPKTFTIKNPSLDPLNLFGISVTGEDSADFIVNTNNTPGSLLPGAQTTFSVTFTPTALGLRSTTLQVLSDDPDEAITDIRLVGTGLPAPEIVIEQPLGTPLASGVSTRGFGNQATNVISLPKVFTIRNTGLELLNIADVSVVTGESGDFIVSTNGLLSSVPPGGETTFAVTFHPMAPGLHTTTLRVLSDDSDEGTNDFTLTGTGVLVPDIVVEQPVGAPLVSGVSTIDFGTQGTDTAGLARTFTIKNTGAAPLTLAGVSASSGDSGDFAVNTNGMLGSVPVGGQTSFTVTFTPTALGVRSTTLQVLSDDPDEAATDIALTGAGILVSEIVVEQPVGAPLVSGVSTIDFGTQGTNTVGLARTFTIKNTGAAPLTLTGVSASSGDSGDFAVNTNGMLGSVAGGGQTSFTVTFTPTALGLRSTLLQVLSDDPDESTTDITLIGTGIALPEIVIEQPLGALQSGTPVSGWGQSGYGQLVIPEGLTGVIAISAGYQHTVVLKNDGTVEAWYLSHATVPAGLSNVTAIAAGGSHTVALKNDGTVVAWGYNSSGQTNVPAGLSNVTAIAAGNHTMALKADGTVVAWGNNSSGQTNVPAGLSGVGAIAAGGNHCVVLKSDGTVESWGDNYFNQTNVPTGLSNVTAISAGAYHTMALKDDGTVEAWGYDVDGESTVPAGLSNVIAISAGGQHSMALRNDGTVEAWGYNYYGQTNVPAGLSGVSAIAAGGNHCLVLKLTAFGNVIVGDSSAPKTFTIKNTGFGPLSIPAVSVTGQTSGDFVVNTNGMLGSIPAGGQTTFSVTFNPGALGFRSTILRVLSDDPDEGITDLTLTGTGVLVPEIVLEQPLGTPLVGGVSTIAFGNQATNNVGTAKTFTVRNTGAAPLSITGVTTANGNSGDFSVDTTGMLGSVPAGGETTFEVSFNPTATGLRMTTLRVLSDDGDEGIIDIALTGAGGLVVTSLADSGAGSLRDIIAGATSGDIIVFDGNLDGGTITLAGIQLTLDKNLAIDASALPNGIIVTGDVTGNGPTPDDSRVFEIPGGWTVEITGLTIVGGHTTGNGGGLLNAGGVLTLNDSILSGNSANEGGGLYSYASSTALVTMNRCQVLGNTATSHGGGVHNTFGAAHIDESTFSGNASTTGGGGGFFDQFSAFGSTVSNSTFTANSAVFGAGLYSQDGSYEVVNSTVVSNTATSNAGGGIYLQNSMATLMHSTFANNTAGGFGGGGVLVGGGTLTFENTIVAGNSGPTGPDIRNVSATIFATGKNLIGDNATVVTEFPEDGILVGGSTLPLVDPLLAPLGDYGGGTETRPLLPGSPAMDAAVVLAGTPATDQRGGMRPSGPQSDIGAVEVFAFSTLTLVDSDNDGLDDRLEPAYGLVVGVDDRTVDSDGDGSSDADELYNMTNPNDPDDRFRVVSLGLATDFDAAAHPSVEVLLSTFPGLGYTLQAGETPMSFLNLTNPPFMATGYVHVVNVILGPGQHFVRAKRN